MFGSWHKVKSKVNFTIHSLKLPNAIQDPFEIEWRRGEFSGITERSYINSQNEVFFEKNINFDVTIYLSKKKEEIRKKIMSFQIYRLEDLKKRRKYGKLNVDIGQFFQCQFSKMCIYPIEDLKEGKSFLVFSIKIIPNDSNQNIVPDISNHNIEKKNENSILIHSNTVVENSNKPELTPDISIIKSNRSRVNSETISISPKKDSSVPIIANQFRKKSLSNFVDKRSYRSSSQINLPPLTQILSHADSFISIPESNNSFVEQDINNNIEEDIFDHTIMIKPEEAISTLNLILDYEWSIQIFNGKHIPKISAVLIASFLNFKLFKNKFYDQKSFEIVINSFIENFCNIKLKNNSSSLEKWFIVIHLLLILKKRKKINLIRFNFFKNKFHQFLKTQLKNYLFPFIEQLNPIIKMIIMNKNPIDFVIHNIQQEFNKIKSNFNQYRPHEYFFSIIIEEFDRSLILFLLNNPQYVSFNNAIFWNSFLTILETESNIELKLFRETSSVIMMCRLLCEEPLKVKDICPNLPIQLVLRLLSSQQPDDIIPFTNDLTKFIQIHQIPFNLSLPEFSSTIYFNIDILEKMIKNSKWREIKLNENDFLTFSFLSKYFK